LRLRREGASWQKPRSDQMPGIFVCRPRAKGTPREAHCGPEAW
jgi:hypothetical protein